MSLAFVLLDQGRVRAAFSVADQAAAAVTGLPAVRVACQRALILQRSGRLDEALAQYAIALPGLRKAGDRLWQARLHNNRGLLLAHRGALLLADADFAQAIQLHRQLGMDLLAAETESNRGNVAALRGDTPAALASYHRADLNPALASKPKPQLLLNRCQALLSVGLFDDARAAAERAVAELRATGHGADLAEAQLWLAEAAAAQGSDELARREARAARLIFSRQGREGWTMLARLVELRAAATAAAPPRGLLRDALTCADDLARAGWQIAELDARLIAARAALATRDTATATAQLGVVGRARTTRPIAMRLRGWHAEALLRNAAGDRRGALSALRAGIAVLERGQAAMSATDMRSHSSTFGTRLTDMGLELAVASDNARTVLAWAERSRARAMRLRPVRPPDDPEMSDALIELRRVNSAATEGRISGAPVPSATAQQAAEERVVRASRTTRSPLYRPVAPPAQAFELADALNDAVLVEFVQRAGSLFAVLLDGGNRCRLIKLAPLAEVQRELGYIHTALRRLASGTGTPRGRAAVRTALDQALQRVDDLLLAPFRSRLGDREVVVVPTGALHSMPWSGLPTLWDRPVRVAPSATSWLQAVRTSDPGSAAVLVAGPGLPGAESEVQALGRYAPDAQIFTGKHASVAAVMSAIDGASVAHLAAHGMLRTDNALLSALRLADGPLTVYDLERLNRPPHTVVLSVCQSGVDAILDGDELIGLVSALLTLGARTVVATATVVSDVHTVGLMLALHDGLRAGRSAAVALAEARAGIDPGQHAAYAAAASFVCFGA